MREARTHHRAVALVATVLLAIAVGARPKPRLEMTLPASSETRIAPSLLDLNEATPGDLERLPGVGPALAARVVEDRVAHGPFERVEDLDRVRGIGPRLIERLRPWVRVTVRTSSAPRPTR